MKSQTAPARSTHRPSWTRITIFVALVALIGIPLFSSSLASSTSEYSRSLPIPRLVSEKGAAVNSSGIFGHFLNAGNSAGSRVFDATSGYANWLPSIAPAALAGETIEIFAADCATPQTAFAAGETICAKTDGVDVSSGNFYVNWFHPDNSATNGGTITTNPQYTLFSIPTSGSYLGTWKANIGRVTPAESSIIGNPPTFTVSAAQTIATFAHDTVLGCTNTPKTNFIVGETVCVRTAGVDPQFNRRFAWVDADSLTREFTPITSDPATDDYALALTETSLGTWKANVVSSRGSTVVGANFTVAAAVPSVDLSIGKGLSSGDIKAGEKATFTISVYSRGPSDAQNVVITDQTPANASYFSATQTVGSGFSCTGTTTVTCTAGVMKAGERAVFEFVYTAGTAGQTITNTATVDSDTAETNTDDNSSTAGPFTIGQGSGGGGGTCTLNCPIDVNTQANTTDPNNPNQPGAVVHYDAPVTEGTCGTLTFSHCNDCFFPQGVTVVSVSETTGASCQFDVVVSAASNAPTISCPSDKVVDANGDCSANVTVGTATATGGENVTIFATRSDGKPMYDCDVNGNNCIRRNPDAPFAGGVTTITWTATSHNANGDETGNSSCTQTITVNNASDDTTAPVITCPANITRANDAGQCSAVINVGTATATDNCDSSPVVVGTRSDNQALTDPYPKGTTTITWTATDASGNSSSCTQTVTVNDTENPTISCPANITKNNDPGTCGAVVSYTAPVGSDNCPGATTARTAGLASGSTFPVGTTTNTFEVTDASGNKTSCSFTVTVNDTENPTISCPANITKNNDPGVCGAVVTYTTPVGSDNCPGATTARTAGLASGSTFPVGTTTNTFEVTDSSGNKTSCSFTVTVNDVEPPVITCPASQTLEPTCPSGAIANWTPPVGTDNCPGAVTTRTAGPAPGSVFPIGSTTVTYTVNDAHGNSTSCSFTVTVKTVLQTLDDLRASVNANQQLNGSQKNGLISKLDAAKQGIQNGQQNQACSKLADFINSTQNFISHGNISASTGNAWISTANNIRNAIGCTNNPCT